MLLRFTVENFLCFAERTCLDLSTAPALAFIVGKNASGKSSLQKALACARNLILAGSRPGQPLPITPHLFAASGPTRFELEVLHGGSVWIYGFALTQTHVEEEWLRQRPARGDGDETTQPLFYRRRSENAPSAVEFGALPADERQRLNLVAYGTRPEQLLLNEGLRRSVRSFASLGAWLRDRLQLILPEAKIVGLAARAAREPRFAAFLGELLRELDPDVKEVSVKREPVPSDTFESEEERRELCAELVRFPDAFAETPDGELVAEKTGALAELQRVRLIFTVAAPDGRSAELPSSALCDGARRILHLAPLLYRNDGEKPESGLATLAPPVFVLDDLVRGLHPALASALLQRFAQQGRTGGQLIATLHDASWLDESQPIYTIEKTARGARIHTPADRT
jgi:hypothetical protein